jgi:hypothetical protein
MARVGFNPFSRVFNTIRRKIVVCSRTVDRGAPRYSS